MNFRFAFFIVLCVLASFTACGSPGYDLNGTSANSILISSSLDRATAALNKHNCSGALEVLSPLFNSTNTNNDIRMMMAAAYGCDANLEVLSVVMGLTTFGGNLGGAGFWEFLVKEFPSTASPDDRIPQAAENGIDAVRSAVNLGAVIAPSDYINSTSYNPEVLLVSDRISNANTYLTFLSMALMGSLMNRYGAPDSNYDRTAALPWLTAATTPGDGCAMAAATLDFFDGVTYLASVAPASTAHIFSKISTLLTAGLDVACALGCSVICAGNVTCTSCPLSLRNRASCTGSTSDINSCAAAGLNNFINTSWTGTP